MKTIPLEIFKVFNEVQSLTSGRIKNAAQAQPIDIETNNVRSLAHAKQVFQHRDQQLVHPRVYIAQFWLALSFFILKEMFILQDLDDGKEVLQPLPHFFLLVLLTLIYEKYIGQLPLQNTVDKLILHKKEYEQKQLSVGLTHALREADYKGPRSGLALFMNSPELEKANQTAQIHLMMRESIVRALSSLKYASFDCVAIAALVLLKLIEKNKNYTLTWYYKPGGHNDGHNFIIAQHNDDRFIVDPWYGICIDVALVQNDPKILLEYPLLSPDDKEVLSTVTPNDYHHYKGYIDILNQQLQANISSTMNINHTA